jgi:hypothetical protein
MMKRFILVCALLVCALVFTMAQGVMSPLYPRDARSMGLGGAFTAISQGYDAFYGNPAGFATAKPQLTIADLSVWTYIKPTQANLAAVEAMISGTSSPASTLNALSNMIAGNGLGGGFSLGMGYVGNGLGLGAFALSDVEIRGATALGASIQASASGNLVIGMGFPVRLGRGTLELGGDVRPLFRADSAQGGWPAGNIVAAMVTGGDPSSAIMSQQVQAGFGLAMDFGAQYEVGSISVGLSVRDVTPSFLARVESLSDLLSQLGSGSLPGFTSDTDAEVLYPYASLGLAWRPKLIPGFIEPGLYAEIQNPAAFFVDGVSPWNLVHLGADLRLLSMFDLRAGINEGWLCAGLGMNFLIFEVDMAAFTEELGSRPGDEPMSGLSLQVSLHF